MVLPFILATVAGAVSVFAMLYVLRTAGSVFATMLKIKPTRYTPTGKPEDDHFQILVVGDIGRSPRMQYHALSIAKHGRQVDIVALKETARHPDLIGKSNVAMYPLAATPEWIAWGNLPFFINIPCKVTHQFFTMFYTLMYTAPAAKWIILQNPPSIPLFHVALLVSYFRGSKIVVDWHNYGHTILAQTKLYRPIVPLYRWYEKRFGRVLGDANLAVTDAMADQLRGDKFKLNGPVYTLHDRPADIFQPIKTKSERLDILKRIAETKDVAQDVVDGNIRLIVSSTSWTPDEDFGILLDALISYAVPEIDDDEPIPIVAIITGKGPQKDAYIEKIKEITEAGKLPGIQVKTAWLSNRGYAELLAAADLGISLHKSSSGVDLPMKVVDMFGSGLPVAAYCKFESFGELIKEGVNGCGFVTPPELKSVLKRLLSDSGADELAKLKKGAINEGAKRWDAEWDSVMPKIIELE